MTPGKLLNLLLMEAQLRLGATKLRGLPYEWEVDVTNICQLHCPLCHTGLDNVRRVKGFMSYDLYTKVIDQIKGSVLWLSLYSWGEPLLHKELPKFVAYAHKNRIGTIISSNLNAHISPERAREIVQSGLDVIIISLDGVTQEVYQQYRVGGQLNRVLDNIRLLTRTKKKLGSSTPALEWQFIVMRQNEHQIPDARKLAKELGVDSITFKKVDFPHGIHDEQLAKQWLPSSASRERKERPFDKPYNENGAGRCWRLWRSSIINWDGGYAPCCYLTDAKDDFGSVTQESIKTIWNNVHYRTARRMFTQKGYLPDIPLGCLSCNVYLDSPAGVYAQRHGLLAGHPKGQVAAKQPVAVLRSAPALAIPPVEQKGTATPK
jgi:MoaA/NifB/PqqE/SkfB family radical SAM enzyme